MISNKRELYKGFALFVIAAVAAMMLFAAPAWAQTTLTVTKTDSPDPVTVGANLTYTINVTAGSTDDADNVMLTDPLPANTTFVSANANCTQLAVGASTSTITCDFGTIAAGDFESVQIVGRPTAAAGEAGFVSNTATADGTNTAPAADTEPTQVVPSDVTITKDDSPDPADVGEALLYTLRITNTGGASQTIIVEDELPDEVDFLAVDPDAPCEESNNLVTCQLP